MFVYFASKTAPKFSFHVGATKVYFKDGGLRLDDENPKDIPILEGLRSYLADPDNAICRYVTELNKESALALVEAHKKSRGATAVKGGLTSAQSAAMIKHKQTMDNLIQGIGEEEGDISPEVLQPVVSTEASEAPAKPAMKFGI